MQILTFLLGGRNFGIPVQDVVFIESRKKYAAYLSGEEKYIRGTIIVKGLTVPVYNLGLRLGVKQQEAEHLVAVCMNGVVTGFEVDKVGEMEDIDDNEILPLPVFMDRTQHGYRNMVMRDSRCIMILDVNDLME